MQSLADSRIVVTGAASGIGWSTVKLLLAEGAQVLASDVADAPAEFRDGLRWSRCDVAQPRQIADLRAAAAAEWGAVDGLVNCAGIAVTGPFLEWDATTWDEVFRVNVTGTYYVIREFADLLRAAGSGRIVNLASTASFVPSPYQTPYAASKAAVLNLTRSAAVSLGPEICVNAVCPGIIDTPMWEKIDAGLKRAGASYDFATKSAESALGRAGTPEEVAQAIAFLLSPAASYVTGAHLTIAGGLVLQ
ncbi:MAG: SDR family oxidoreductase [Propionibacteriaceae bacterium]|nr:SDR family oxidoreductase [Propionibacteriaceae bacterium]